MLNFLQNNMSAIAAAAPFHPSRDANSGIYGQVCKCVSVYVCKCVSKPTGVELKKANESLMYRSAFGQFKARGFC